MENERVTVSTGVVFEIKDVPVVAFRDLQKRLNRERPKVPVTYIEDKDREEENPNDPDYQKALKEWDEDTELKLMDFIIMTGTSAIESPKTISHIESEDWADEYRFLGFNVPEKGGVRYLAWVKYCACPKPADFQKLVLAAGRRLGVTEEDVAEAATQFQNRKARRTNTKSPNKARSK